MMIEANIMPKERLHDLMAEADEIPAMTVSSIKTAPNNSAWKPQDAEWTKCEMTNVNQYFEFRTPNSAFETFQIPRQGIMVPRLISVVLAIIVLFTTQSSFGLGVFEGPDHKAEPRILSLPYGFYNENFGLAAAYVYGITGYPQKQSAILATAMAGTKGSALGFLMGRDLQLPWSKRLFLDPVVSIGYFKENDAYINGNPRFPNEDAGSNDSDDDNFIEGDGMDNFFRLRFKYLLPMGHGRDKVINAYVIDRGALTSGASGGESLNPFKSGQCFLELRPFYRSLEINGDYIEEKLKTNGFDFSILWDNRDFFANPSRGNGLRFRVSRDFGWLNSSDSWTNLDGELDVYFPLGTSERFRSKVLAFDFWTSYSPTWDKNADGSISNRPPAYTGSTLGGLWRLRGYKTQRFSDKAAIYYSAELRLMPRWNPFEGRQWLQKYLGVQWLQIVPFGEIGRVSPSWNLSKLHSDMKWCLGLGLRAWAKGLVARIDTATSEEELKIQMMISQPFQF